jgi:hypothetical protein
MMISNSGPPEREDDRFGGWSGWYEGWYDG